MGDVKCKYCGEPWDYYGLLHGDVEEDEGQAILNGKGCPACNWGRKCPLCGGTGVDVDFDDDEVDENELVIRDSGLVGIKCSKCNGTGKPKPDTLNYVMSIDDGTDLDPTAFI